MLLSRFVKVEEARFPREIKEAFHETLHVPDDALKSRIVDEYADYLVSASKSEDHKIKTFIAWEEGVPMAMATCHVHPAYTSYGKESGAIGWVSARDLAVLRSLMSECEAFFLQKKIHDVRCGVNFPKSLGGLGFQVSGFDEAMLYGVSFSSAEKKEVSLLKQLGYEVESYYTCLKVSARTWQKGKALDDTVRFEYLPIKELKGKIEEVQDLARKSFQVILPDTYEGRFGEFINAFEQMPPSKDSLDATIELTDLSSSKAFLEAWESCDLERIVPLMPIACEKRTGNLVGVLLGLPDLFQRWKGEKITRVNVDTAIVRKNFRGKGLFSALNNIGQLTCRLFGMTYFEGTTVWTGNSRGVNNTDAIRSIMPHCVPVRKHVVLQKKLKRIKS